MSTMREPQAKRQSARIQQVDLSVAQDSDLLLEESKSVNLSTGNESRRTIELRPTNILALQRAVGNRIVEQVLQEQSRPPYRKSSYSSHLTTLQRDEINNSAATSEKLAAIQGLAMYELLPALSKLPGDILNNEGVGQAVGGPRLIVAMQAARAKREGTVTNFLEKNKSILLRFENTNPDQVSDIRAFLGLLHREHPRIVVKLAAQTIDVYEGSRVVLHITRLKGGRKSDPTPIGKFTVTRTDKKHISSQFHAPMPYSVFFRGGSAFHQGSLTSPSHGCIHLSEPDAHNLFNWVEQHQPLENISVDVNP